MQSIGISKKLKFGNECFEIIYYGKVCNIAFNKSEAEKLLDDFIEKQEHSNMLENVAAVRSIFSGCREEVLGISYADEREYEAVQYNNLNLCLFKKEKMSMDNEHDVRYTFKYDSSGIKLDCYNAFSDLQVLEATSDEFAKITKHIYELKNVDTIKLDDDSKKLIEIYKLFYNENPDFSKNNIITKVQVMMSILASFGIYLGEDYSFVKQPILKIPTSLNLANLVKKLNPLGEVNCIVDPVTLDEHQKNVIKIIGENIREEIENVHYENEPLLNKDEVLLKIGQLFYLLNHNSSTSSKVSEICKNTDCKQEDIELGVQLVKRIKDKINTEDV